jgi:uncharacterized repeat protein (TIGR01451 family)
MIAPTSLHLRRWLFAGLCALGISAAHAAPTVAIVTSNATPVAGGAAYSYTITVNNPDGVTANNLVFSLALPSAVLFLNLSITGTGAGAFSCNQPPVSTNGQILCRAVSLAAGATATFTAVAQIQPEVASGVRTATARLTVGSTESSSSVQNNIQINAPLAISLSGPAAATPGSRLSYLLTLNNGGNSTTLNSTLSAVLPVGFSHFSVQGVNGLANACDYTAATRTLSCAAVNIPSGSNRLTWTVEVAPTMPAGQVQVSSSITTAGTGTIAVGSSNVFTTISN